MDQDVVKSKDVVERSLLPAINPQVSLISKTIADTLKEFAVPSARVVEALRSKPLCAKAHSIESGLKSLALVTRW